MNTPEGRNLGWIYSGEAPPQLPPFVEPSSFTYGGINDLPPEGGVDPGFQIATPIPDELPEEPTA